MLGRVLAFVVTYAAIIIPLVLVTLMVVSESVRDSVAFVVRMLARVLLIAAVIALVYDGTKTLASGSKLVLTPLREHWQNLSPGTLASFKALIGHLHAAAWDLGVLRFIGLPAWLVIGGIGFLLAWLGRKRRKVNVFVN